MAVTVVTPLGEEIVPLMVPAALAGSATARAASREVRLRYMAGPLSVGQAASLSHGSALIRRQVVHVNVQHQRRNRRRIHLALLADVAPLTESGGDVPAPFLL